jgi:energy-coupling factor transporter transmembrane protein EcfT
MAEIDLFHYRKGSGFLHSIDPRIKLLIFFLLTLITFQSNNVSLIIISFTVILLFLLEYRQSGILSPLRFLKTISFFLLFLLFITLGKWFAIGGIEGLLSGVVYSWKLLIILVNGQLLISTTDPSGIHNAVYKTLKPVPLVPAGQIATMVSLTITFIPLLFDQYLECRDANNSRLGNTARNPLKKIFSIVYPLLLNTIFRADEIAMAMESRCYNENPTMPDMEIKRQDLFCLFFMLVYFAGIIFLNIVFGNS